MADDDSIERFIANARKDMSKRDQGYREQSLRIHPWICGRCGREFTRQNLHLLTVHHKDHNHDNNPPDGSNWENLCVYCHDNEHSRYEEERARGKRGDREPAEQSTYNPFAGLKDKLK
jgi:5-methylcytosine-specific restriction endonuclease McrA